MITIQNSTTVSCAGGYAMLCDFYATGTDITINGGSTVTGNPSDICLMASASNTTAFQGVTFNINGESKTYEELTASEPTGGAVGGIDITVDIYN